MADEIIYRSSSSGETLYSILADSSGDYWDIVASEFEELDSDLWSDYNVTMAESPSGSYQYISTFPTHANTPAGQYGVYVYQQAGEAVNISDDILLADSVLNWGGTQEIGLYGDSIGDITGDITGDLSGSVASVTAKVNVSDVDDKTDYALSAASQDAVASDVWVQTSRIATSVSGNVDGSVASVTNDVTISLTQEVSEAPTNKTVGEALYTAIAGGKYKLGIVGTTMTLYKSDSSTAFATWTLDNATNPTSRTP